MGPAVVRAAAATAVALKNGGSPAATLFGGQWWRQRCRGRWRRRGWGWGWGWAGRGRRAMEVHHRFLADHLVALAEDERPRRHHVLDSAALGDERAVAGLLGGNDQLGAIADPHPAVLKPPGVLQIATREASVLPNTTVASAVAQRAEELT